jgi:hypothetical protein
MKFTQTGTYKQHTLTKRVNIIIPEQVQDIFFDRLDYFLGFIAAEKPESVSKFITNLTQRYQNLVTEDFLEISLNNIEIICSQLENLQQRPELVEAALNYFIELLHLDDKSAWEMNDLEISMKSLIQAWTYPSYFSLQTLAETIDRQTALNLFKHYITQYYRDHPSPNRDKFASLEEMLAHRLSGDTTSSDWVIVHSMLSAGKYAFKNKNCPTCVDAMMELSDPELKYLVCCYGDYEKFRASYGDHIILTMEHTLMAGDSYCSRLLHDTRIDYDLKHPSQEFWDNFEPGNEEIAKKYYNRA